MLFRHSAVYLVGRLASAGLSLAAIWVFTRLFAPGEYGYYVTSVTVATLLTMIFFNGLRMAQSRLAILHKDGGLVQQTGLYLFVMLCACLTVLALILSLLPLPPAIGIYVGVVLVMTLAMAASEYALMRLNTDMKPGAHLAFSLMRDGGIVVMTLLFYWLGLAERALVAGYIAANLVPQLIWSRSWLRGSWPPRRDAATMTEILRFAVPSSGSQSLIALIMNFDRLLLPVLVSTAAAGLYGAPYGLARQSLSTAMQAVNLAAQPLALKAYKTGGDDAARAQMKDNFSLQLAIAIPAVVGLSVLAPAIAGTLFGADYVAEAARLLPWLAIGTLFMGLRTYYVDQAFNIKGEARRPLQILLATVVIVLPISAYLVYHHGLHGAAFSVLISGAFSLLLSWHLSQKVFRLALPLRDMAWIGAGAAAMGLLLWPFRHMTGWIPLVLLVGSGGAVYGSVCFTGNIMGLRHKIMKFIRKKGRA